ncbi:MAG: hypothetical protein ACRCYU_12435, partial [Nocardioides sp.]
RPAPQHPRPRRGRLLDRPRGERLMGRHGLSEAVFGLNYADRAHLDGDRIEFAEGDSQRVVQLMLDVGDEALSMVFDAYHLRQFRLAVQRAERWVNAEGAGK